eukprot:m.74925 g.74925  ORF g.74925 m.74925 type:complete len:353 (-) comp14547_c0_seq1:204-1262(-)
MSALPTPRTLIRALSKAGDTPASGRRQQQSASQQQQQPSSGLRNARSVAAAAVARSSPLARSAVKASASRLQPQHRSSALRRGMAAMGAAGLWEEDTPRTLIRKTLNEKRDAPSARKGTPQQTATQRAGAGSTPRTLIRRVSEGGAGAAGAADTSLGPSMPGSADGSFLPQHPGEVSFGGMATADDEFEDEEEEEIEEEEDDDTVVHDASLSVTAHEEEAQAQKRKPRARAERGSVVLPATLAKTMFTSFSQLRPTPDCFPLVQEGLSRFMDQVVEDLHSYAKHAGRMTIERADVELLTKRQRVSGAPTLETLIHQYLPMEVIEQLVPVAAAHNKVVPAPRAKKARRSKTKE